MTASLSLPNEQLQPRGPAGAFVLTDDQVAQLGGGKKTFPVLVQVNGHQLRLRLARMGGENLIGLSKATRAEAEVEIGAEYDITVAPDLAERVVEVPPDFAEALAAHPELSAKFAALPYSHRKEYVEWILSAKREQTRTSRVAKALERLGA